MLQKKHFSKSWAIRTSVPNKKAYKEILDNDLSIGIRLRDLVAAEKRKQVWIRARTV